MIAGLLITTMMVSLSGCSKGGDSEESTLSDLKKSELVTMVEDYQNKVAGYNTVIESKNQKIEELETLLKGVTTETENSAGIREFTDGTGRLTLQSVDSLIELPTSFTYPNSVQSSNTYTVNVSKDVAIKPSNNWTIQMNANEAVLQHNSGITGTINVSVIDKTLGATPKVTDVQTTISEFFGQMPASTITYNRIYIGNSNYTGVDALATTYVDENPGFIRCGMIGSGSVAVTYMFYYSGEQDSAKDELVLNLLQTMTVLSGEIRIGS